VHIYVRMYDALQLQRVNLVCCILTQRSMSEESKPESPPTNGVSSLSLTVPSPADSQLTAVTSDEVKQSDTSSSLSSPFSPSGHC